MSEGSQSSPPFSRGLPPATGRTRIAGVFGWPVSHSRSPRLHGYWLAKYGIDGAYIPLATRPEHLGPAIRALPLLGFRGANITLPHKERALSHVDRLSPIARRIGAVNTLIISPEGEITGDNTDAFGFIAHLRASLPDWRVEGEAPVLILGAGGAARAIAIGLSEAGAKIVLFANRTERRAVDLAAALGTGFSAIPWADRASALRDARLLVNATQLGQAGQAPLDLELHNLSPKAPVYDIVYVPQETPLLARARARGHPVIDGIGMLLHQARPGFAAWFGRDPEIDPALRDYVLAAG